MSFAIAGRGTGTGLLTELSAGDGGVAEAFVFATDRIAIAVGGDGGLSAKKVGGAGGEADCFTIRSHSIAVGGTGGQSFGLPPDTDPFLPAASGGRAHAESEGTGFADACGGKGGVGRPGTVEQVIAGKGGNGGMATAVIRNFGHVTPEKVVNPDESVKVLFPGARAEGGVGGTGGQGLLGSLSAPGRDGGAGGDSGDSLTHRVNGPSNRSLARPLPVKGGTGGRGGNGHPAGIGGPGGSGNRQSINTALVGVGPDGDQGEHGTEL